MDQKDERYKCQPVSRLMDLSQDLWKSHKSSYKSDMSQDKCPNKSDDNSGLKYTKSQYSNFVPSTVLGKSAEIATVLANWTGWLRNLLVIRNAILMLGTARNIRAIDRK